MKIAAKIIFPLMVAALGMLPFCAFARLSGEAALGYVKYDVDANGQKKLKASSFEQQYSLLYSKSNDLMQGRLGGYRMSVGYEWGTFDTKIETPTGSINPSMSRGHILYEGDIQLDPAEIPLRVRAFSRQTSRILMHPDTAGPLSRGEQMISPDLPTDMSDGTNITSGVTLLLAPKNGMTSRYNALFDYFPLLYLDYRDDLHRDLASMVPVDTRLRRLAFVSLNRRDNWFHFRSTQYDDYITSEVSFKEYQVQIGTIDQNMSRRWVDFSNWIKISADGQFTKRMGELSTNRFQEYDLNMFTVASRRKWEGRTFMNFNRAVEHTGLSVQRSLPIYLNGIYGDETDWKVRFSSRDKNEKLLSGVDDNEADTLMSVRVETFKRHKFTFSQQLSVEHKDTSASGETLTLEGGLETASTRRFSDQYSVSGRYNVRRFANRNSSGEESIYYNHDLSGRISYNASRLVRFDLEQNVQIATGKNPQNIANDALFVNEGISGSRGDGFARREGSLNEYVRSVTTVVASWTPTARLRLSLSATEDILSQKGVPTDYLTTLRNSFDYTLSNITLRIDNRANIKNANGMVATGFESYGTTAYRPNRHVDGSLQYRYNYAHDISGNSTFLDLKQKLGYYVYRRNGVDRRLLELTEELTYYSSDTDQLLQTQTTRGLMVGARYYPIKRLYVASNIGYSWVDPEDYEQLLYSASLGVNFTAFQASLDYTHGKRNSADNRIEDRVAANVRKLF